MVWSRKRRRGERQDRRAPPETSITRLLFVSGRENELATRRMAHRILLRWPRPQTLRRDGSRNVHDRVRRASEALEGLRDGSLRGDPTLQGWRKREILQHGACLMAPTGKVVAHYRKLTPWPFPGEILGNRGRPGRADLRHGIRTRVGLCDLLRYPHNPHWKS